MKLIRVISRNIQGVLGLILKKNIQKNQLKILIKLFFNKNPFSFIT